MKPVLVKNQFGGAIGGPVPMFLRGKIFYFGDFEGNRQVQGQYSASTVPNANQRQGIFTDTTGQSCFVAQPAHGRRLCQRRGASIGLESRWRSW